VDSNKQETARGREGLWREGGDLGRGLGGRGEILEGAEGFLKCSTEAIRSNKKP
jgi:hypothetical protein